MSTVAEQQNRAAPPADPLSFADAVPRFLEYVRSYRSYSPSTVRAYATDLRQFQEFLTRELGCVPGPGELTREQVIQFGVTLSGRAPLTIRRKLACLSSFFGFLSDMGLITGNPARRLPLPKTVQPVPVCLTEEQAQRLLEAAHTPWHRALIAVLLFTGLRRSEAVAITLEDLDLEKGQLLVHGKGSKDRVVPLTPLVVQAIGEYLACRPQTQSHRLFLSRIGGNPIAGRVVNRMLVRVLGEEKRLGEGEVGLERFLAKLKEVGYEGPITIEREVPGEQQMQDFFAGKKLLEGLKAKLRIE